MAKTLLQIVKNTLESMDSDPIDSIFIGDGGTEESEQIASFAGQLYEYMHSIYDWPYSKILTQLDALADSDKPNYLSLPITVGEVHFIKYREKNIEWVTPEVFLDRTNERNTLTKNANGVYQDSLADNTVSILSFEGIRLFTKTNSDPTYYTSFDNKHLVFDSYDIANDTTLQNSNSAVYATRAASFPLDNDAIPEFPDGMYPLFQAELNREASLRLKQVDSPVDAKRALVSMAAQRTKADRVNKRAIAGFGRK
jgi:hypothetical protein